MPSDEEFRELKDQVASLSSALATARRRIDDLEDGMADHLGLDWGESLVDANSPHPNMSVNTIESGGGIIRQDQNGMQIATEGEDTATIWFVDELVPDPQNESPVVKYQGSAAGGSASSYQGAFGSPGTAAIELQGWSDRSAAYIYAYPIGSGNAVSVSLYKTGTNTSGLSQFSVNGCPLLLDGGPIFGSSADPSTTLSDGMIWYRSDTDKFRVRANGATENLAVENTLIHGDGSELTIATGAITITTGYHRVDTQADAATDDLDTISGGTTGQILVIRAENDARDVVAKDGTGNLLLAGDCTLDNTADTLTLIYNGTNWLELSRSDNGA